MAVRQHSWLEHDAPAVRAAAGRAVEMLERRVLLSAEIINGTLRILGTDRGEQITLDTDGNVTKVGFGRPRARPQLSSTFPNSAFARIFIDAKGGDDSVNIGDAVLHPATILGGRGDDYLKGGGGDDVIRPGLGNDTLEGGGTAHAPGGINTADYSDRTEAISFNSGILTTASGERDTLALGSSLQRLLTGSGDDVLYVNANYPGDTKYIDSGGGNDQVTLWMGGYAGDGTVRGGAGDDRIMISGYKGTYYGDEGDDTFEVFRSSNTAREFFGGPGIDTVDYQGRSGGGSFFGMDVTLDDQPNDGSRTEYRYQPMPDNVHTDVERVLTTSWGGRVIGSAHDETLIGNQASDILVSGGGRDCLEGNSGNDLLISTTGRSTLVGGDGIDTLIGSSSDTFVTDGDDVVIDRALALVGGVLVVRGDEQANFISVLPHPEESDIVLVTLDNESQEFSRADIAKVILIGNGGADQIQIGDWLAVPCSVYGGDGDDTITGSGAWVSAGAGDDSVTGGLGSNYILGGPGNDTIASTGEVYAEDGDDVVTCRGVVDGGRGDDWIQGGGMLIGGPGNDTLRGGGTADVFQPESTYPYVLIPAYWAALGDDDIDGGGGNDKISDFDGFNTLNGGAGNDTISATGDEASLINGGAGDDSLTGVGGTHVFGGPGRDTLSGQWLDGGDGDDVFLRGFGAQTMFGGAGNDLFSDSFEYFDDVGRDYIDAGDGDDTVYGGASNDTILGGAGRDVIYGRRGDDYIDGGPGDDCLFGNEGDDTLIGGPGVDILDGGPGNNVLIDDLPARVRPRRIAQLVSELR